MITVKYPEHIKAQLKILDERIAEIYQTCMSEKVRLIQNCCPTYIVNGDIVIKGEDK